MIGEAKSRAHSAFGNWRSVKLEICEKLSYVVPNSQTGSTDAPYRKRARMTSTSPRCAALCRAVSSVSFCLQSGSIPQVLTKYRTTLSADTVRDCIAPQNECRAERPHTSLRRGSAPSRTSNFIVRRSHLTAAYMKGLQRSKSRDSENLNPALANHLSCARCDINAAKVTAGLTWVPLAGGAHAPASASIRNVSVFQRRLTH
jgi:hypothetical protein